MAVIDVEQLLQEVDPEAPCGEDLEYDPAFGALERAAEGKPEQQMGDAVVPAEEANWSEVKKQATALLARSKDLRVAVYLARALLHTEGLAGFHAGLTLVHGLIDRYWSEVHPQLDPEDDNDPTLRVNTLATLTDPALTLAGLLRAPLVAARGLGEFSLRDLEIATGKRSPTGDEATAELPVIDAAFLECDVEGLQATAAAAEGALLEVEAIDAALMERVGAAAAVDLDPLRALLAEAQAVLADHLGRRGAGAGTPAAAAEATAPGGAAVPAPITGEIQSREEVIRLLDKMCDYFYQYEPSSPVPLLLQRAKRLVAKNFMDILRDLTPDAVGQAELFRGVDTNEQ